jgi:hypothetical protein
MALYTVRLLVDRDAAAVSHQFDSATESEAVGEMLNLAGERPAELWCDDRQVLWWPGRVIAMPVGGRKRPSRLAETSLSGGCALA